MKTKKPKLYSRFFVAYMNKKGQYIEEDFNSKTKATARADALDAKGLETNLYTRERVYDDTNLYPAEP